MFDYDRSNFIEYLKQFPRQISAAREEMKDFSADIDIAAIQHIIFAGMGGSAISGDLLLSYSASDIKRPASVIRNYAIPSYVNENTLVVGISYSGNTEETLSVLHRSIDQKAKVISISSGGQIAALAEQHGHPHITVPEGLPPRQALGHLFFSLLFLFEKLGIIPAKTEQVKETERLMHELMDRFNPESSQGHNLANHIAQSIYHAIPVVYTGVSFLEPVPVRWRNQFNENSKVMAFSNVFPELNHNEIVGWDVLPEVSKHFRVIFLRDPEEPPRIRQRISITKSILKGKNILFGEIFAEGESRLARLFSLIYTGDWASYYLAMLNEQDPVRIDSIDLLKRELSEAEV